MGVAIKIMTMLRFPLKLLLLQGSEKKTKKQKQNTQYEAKQRGKYDKKRGEEGGERGEGRARLVFATWISIMSAKINPSTLWVMIVLRNYPAGTSFFQHFVTLGGGIWEKKREGAK